MGCKLNLLILFLFYVIILLNYNVNAASWPTGFGWGTATASYQVEGSWNVSGRGLQYGMFFLIHQEKLMMVKQEM